VAFDNQVTGVDSVPAATITSSTALWFETETSRGRSTVVSTSTRFNSTIPTSTNALENHHHHRNRLRSAPGLKRDDESVSELIERLTESTWCSSLASVPASATTSTPAQISNAVSERQTTNGLDSVLLVDLGESEIDRHDE